MAKSNRHFGKTTNFSEPLLANDVGHYLGEVSAEGFIFIQAQPDQGGQK
jgi:hypothetical protein